MRRIWSRIAITSLGGWNPFYSPSRHLDDILQKAGGAVSEGVAAEMREVLFGDRAPQDPSAIPYDENGLIQWVDPETEALSRRYTEAMIAIEERREQLRRQRYQEEAQINAGFSID